MANKMSFQAVTAFGAAGSAFSSTTQITVPGTGTNSGNVYLATTSQTILQGLLPGWAYLTLSSTGSQNVAFEVNPDGAGTAWLTWANIANSVTLVYLDGTGGQRLRNLNTIPVAAQITVIKQ